ncbi:putative oxidoreductase C2F3.05c [Apiospora saccharicola]|uniref:Oxidoreductase C2F3.05c n=1 Tax=Apiospora saccharicola TaxID=335842 RepID=A0ABR1WNL0_9PEZI
MTSNLTIQSNIKLNSGYEIPRLGFGVYQVPIDQAESCVREALTAGYRHIDSAVGYRNEAPCGKAIREFASSPASSSSAGGSGNATTTPREQIFFTSKVRPLNLSYESAKTQVDATLSETGLGYIDLMLIHAPYGGPVARKGAWKALVEAVDAGKVRSIGVSNYGVHHLDELEAYTQELAAERGGDVKSGKGGIISVGQWEVHPWCPRNDIVDWCRARGVAVEAYCPVVRGERAGEAVLQELAAKYKKTWAQVLIRWSLQKGHVPLPKSVTPSRIRENADVYDFEISEEDMARLEMKEYAPCAWDPTTSPLDNGK